MQTFSRHMHICYCGVVQKTYVDFLLPKSGFSERLPKFLFFVFTVFRKFKLCFIERVPHWGVGHAILIVFFAIEFSKYFFCLILHVKKAQEVMKTLSCLRNLVQL